MALVATSLTEPIVVAVVVSGDFPDASNTGTSGTLTPSGSVTSSADNQIIENLTINPGNIVVTHSGVTVRNCRIVCDNSDVTCCYVTGNNATVEDCELLGTVDTPGHDGVFMDGGSACTVRRCNIHGVEDGVVIGDKNDHIVRDNYIHDLLQPDNPDPHHDGVQVHGGHNVTNVLIEHNNIDGNLNPLWSSCITTADILNSTINNNRLIGAGTCLYFEGVSSGNVVTNNRFQRLAVAGFYLGGATFETQSYSGNVRDSDGAPLDLPNE